MMCSNVTVLNSREKPAVSPISGNPTFDTGETKQKRGQLNAPPRLTCRRSNEFSH